MGIVVTEFGTSKGGKKVFLYSLENKSGMQLVLTNIGAAINKIIVPDRNGVMADVVTGFDTVEGYERNPGFYGAVIGPYANRTKGAQFTIDGVTYKLVANENGCNNLHCDYEIGIHKKVWDASVDEASNSVTFTVECTDGEMGFPGNKVFSVTYTLTEDNIVRLHYHATTDKKCPINLTNHAYFNLSGDHSGKILDTMLTINANQIIPTDNMSIPTGEFMDVTGTPFDFRTEKKIGDDIAKDHQQLIYGGGYDHCYVVNGEEGIFRFAAKARDEKSGRYMDTFTDQIGLQLYTGNFMENPEGKNGKGYEKRDGFCLESHMFPNAVNEDKFPDVIYGPGKDYDTTTEYRFGTF